MYLWKECAGDGPHRSQTIFSNGDQDWETDSVGGKLFALAIWQLLQREEESIFTLALICPCCCRNDNTCVAHCQSLACQIPKEADFY